MCVCIDRCIEEDSSRYRTIVANRTTAMRRVCVCVYSALATHTTLHSDPLEIKIKKKKNPHE